MGRIFLAHPGGARLYSCANCDTALTNRSQLTSMVSLATNSDRKKINIKIDVFDLSSCKFHKENIFLQGLSLLSNKLDLRYNRVPSLRDALLFCSILVARGIKKFAFNIVMKLICIILALCTLL